MILIVVFIRLRLTEVEVPKLGFLPEFINKLKLCVLFLPALIHLNVKHEHTNLDYIIYLNI